MAPVIKKVIGAMFDVRPVTATGELDVAKIQAVSRKLNLRKDQPRRPITAKLAVSEMRPLRRPLTKSESTTSSVQTVPPVIPVVDREHMLKEIETMMHQDQSLEMTLAKFSSKIKADSKPRYRPVVASSVAKKEQKQYKTILSALSHPLPSEDQKPSVNPYKSEEESKVRWLQSPQELLPQELELRAPEEQKALPELLELPPERSAEVESWYEEPKIKAGPSLFVSAPSSPRAKSNLKKIFIVAGIILIGSVGVYGASIHGRVIREGSTAVQSLQDAKTSLEHFDFATASDNFLAAQQEFSKASEDLNLLGSIASSLPGGSKVTSAQNIMQVGKLVADSGHAMADAIKAIGKTSWILNPQSSSRVFNAEILLPLKRALATSKTSLAQAGKLMASIDIATIPEDKQKVFLDFKEKLPGFEQLLNEASGYADFLDRFVGSSGGTKKYLVLFENSSELRPTGGFPGTYGVMTIQNGRVTNFFADDIYNLDGQLKDLIIPPKQLQHITPTWGLRDANWFVDFPTSARKIMQFFPKEAGYDVDGVITIDPQIMSDVLKVIGPVTIPQYNLTINSDNFLSTLQSQVEYGDDKKENKPKQVITDLAPIILTKLYSSNQDTWLELFKGFMKGLAAKDILMYFNDPQLEQFAKEKGFGGEINDTKGDYLMVTFSNVKGAKSDAVTDSAVQLETKKNNGNVDHVLTITRRHNGGHSQLGFYNRPNPTYVRVLVPNGSVLTDIRGNSNPNYKPLMSYTKDFVKDPELDAYEHSAQPSSDGVVTYMEGGKTEFGFWMVIDPGKTETITLKYSIPDASPAAGYGLYIQKQPGITLDSLSINLFGEQLFNGKLEQDISLPTVSQ